MPADECETGDTDCGPVVAVLSDGEESHPLCALCAREMEGPIGALRRRRERGDDPPDGGNGERSYY